MRVTLVLLAALVASSGIASQPADPCAHCTNAGAVAEVIASVLGTGTLAAPLSAPAPGVPATSAAVRRWNRVDDLVQEVADARVWSGIHFRTSTEVGVAMGREVGRYVVKTQLLPLAR